MKDDIWWALARPFTWYRTCKLTGERLAVLERRVIDALMAEHAEYTPSSAALEVASHRGSGKTLHLEDATFHCEEH